jgi:hypothetical protein
LEVLGSAVADTWLETVLNKKGFKKRSAFETQTSIFAIGLVRPIRTFAVDFSMRG